MDQAEQLQLEKGPCFVVFQDVYFGEGDTGKRKVFLKPRLSPKWKGRAYPRKTRRVNKNLIHAARALSGENEKTERTICPVA